MRIRGPLRVVTAISASRSGALRLHHADRAMSTESPVGRARAALVKESVAARQPMPAWRLSQDGVERIRATMLKFNKDQDARRAEAAASEACRWKSLSVSTEAMTKQVSKGRMSGEVAALLPGYQAKQSADLDMLHVVGEEVAALFKSPAPLDAGAEQNGRGKAEIYPAISTRKAATNNRFHRESPSWEVDPGHDSLSFVSRTLSRVEALKPARAMTSSLTSQLS